MNFVPKSGMLRLYLATSAAGSILANFKGETDPSVAMKDQPEVSVNITQKEAKQLDEYLTSYRKARNEDGLQKEALAVVISPDEPNLLELPHNTLQDIESSLKKSLNVLKGIRSRVETTSSIVQ